MASAKVTRTPLANQAQLNLGLFVLFLKKRLFRRKVVTPTQIHDYSLIKELKADDPERSYSVGIYQKGKKKFFIKSWSGRVKDYTAMALAREAYFSQTLFELLSLQHKSTITTPKVIETIRDQHSFSIVYEFIDGKLLSSCSKQVQAEQMCLALAELRNISQKKTALLQRFPKKSSSSYFFLLFPSTLILAVLNPSKIAVIWNHFKRALQYYSSSETHPLTLAHRDLDPSNMMYAQGRSYICDCESMALTVPKYDLTFLACQPEREPLVQLITTKMKIQPNKFLLPYLTLFTSLISDNLLQTNVAILERNSEVK